MKWRNSSKNYGLVQIVLHWLLALTVFGMILLGLWMTGLDYYDPWYKKGPDLHRAVGMLFGLALLFRLLWRLTNPQPESLAATDWEHRAARYIHRLLYLLPLLIVASGYLLSTADARSVDVFGWFEVPATLHGIDRQEDIAGEIHFWLAMTLLAIVSLHLAAALRHHFFLRDETLRRMLFTNTDKHPSLEDSNE